ncbi:OmpA family protein [Desulfobacterales bacterium HSG2]|nr:OmpA family protein [Desulfobacterales bacterium HSG2]
MMKNFFFTFAMVGGIILSGMTGCASKKYVNEKIELLAIKNQELGSDIGASKAEMDADISKVWKELEMNQQDIARLRNAVANQREEFHKKLINQKEKFHNELTNQKEEFHKELTSTQGAVARAMDAERVKKGKLLYEMTMSDESVFFAYKETELSENARSALDVFAMNLISENKEVFIEIQGHTDDIGSDEYNFVLGQARSEAVLRYLHTEHKIPLHRMSAFSYGESRPVALNETESDRAKNRRVVLVVME